MQKDIIYYKDARDMSEVDDNSITLIVTSPPYWNIKNYSLNSPKQKGQIGSIEDYRQYLCALNMVWKECERVLEPNGKLCVNAPLMPIPKKHLNTHHTRDIFNLYSDIEHGILKQTELYFMDLYIWNRMNPTKKLMFGSYPYPSNFYAQNTAEFIGIFVKDGKPKSHSPEIKEASKLIQEEWINFTKQIWDIPIPNKGDVAYGEHPAIMPLEIASRLIRLYSFVDDIVLDPFLGSGTTAKAALQNRRHYIGYEINPAYKEIIEAKLKSK
ncbi:TPA: site-specific DNA-methyltransferase [Candidatus Poribacteria bacterium]|nr:site-specific DNA-methyltransferase [Candidatus Poribacteria bacterium]